MTAPDAAAIWAQIEAGLEGVSAGPWLWARQTAQVYFATAGSHQTIADVYQRQEDGAHIARLDPDTVRALLAERAGHLAEITAAHAAHASAVFEGHDLSDLLHTAEAEIERLKAEIERLAEQLEQATEGGRYWHEEAQFQCARADRNYDRAVALEARVKRLTQHLADMWARNFGVSGLDAEQVNSWFNDRARAALAETEEAP